MPSHNCIIITMFSFQGTSRLPYSPLRSLRFLRARSGFHSPFEFLYPRNSMKPQTVFQHFVVSVNFLVESTGIEPVTSCLQGRRSPSWANPPYWVHPVKKWWAKWWTYSRLDYTRFRSCNLSCSTSPFALNFFSEVGGPKWTRTIDLTIISRVL